MTAIIIYTFGFLMLASGIGVLLMRNPVKAALFLVSFFVSLAAIYAAIGAVFMATVQVLVYVGAIMVLFLFVIMLIALREEQLEGPGDHLVRTSASVALGIAFVVQIAIMAWSVRSVSLNANAPYSAQISEGVNITGNSAVVSDALFRKYLLPFEIISVILLIAVLGAILVARKHRERLS